MVHSIPWYIVLLVSIPEAFLSLSIGFKLFNVRVDNKSIFILAVLAGILSLPVNITIIITILIQAFFFIIVNHYIYILDDVDSLKPLLPFINILMVVLLIFIFRSIKKLESTARKRLEANLLKEHLNQIENLLKTMQTQKHDHTKHMQTLQAMIYLDEIEEAKNYIDGIAESYWYTDKIKDAGHPALTALLNSKHKIAEIKKIKFDFSVKCNLENIYLLSWDLCSIIGNLLDNAFECRFHYKMTTDSNFELTTNAYPK